MAEWLVRDTHFAIARHARSHSFSRANARLADKVVGECFKIARTAICERRISPC